MNVSTKLLLTVGLTTLLFTCSQNRKERMNDNANPSADSTANKFISTSAAVENGKDSTRMFIRTADLKFKVKSVVNATYAIENITSQLDGFVTYANLNSTIDNKTTTAISADSSLETTYFSVVNQMTLRVPNTKLDTTLKAIATLIDYLDYRVIKADDVALQILSNKLTQDRVSKNEQRLTNAIDNRGKKLNETANAEELLLNKQEQSGNAKISNLSLQDQINFSTITLSIYQRQTFKRELISNNKNIDAYIPSLGSRIFEALKAGWDVLEAIIVFIAQLWGIIILAIVVYILYRKFGN